MTPKIDPGSLGIGITGVVIAAALIVAAASVVVHFLRKHW